MNHWVIATSLVVVASTAAHAETLHYTALLTSRAEVPAVKAPGAGVLSGKLETTNRRLSYRVKYSGLTGPADGAHFHGPAGPRENAPHVIMLGMDGHHEMAGMNSARMALTSPIAGSVTLTTAQMADLRSGKWYVNIHTEAHPDGEIRGQIVPAGGSVRAPR